MGAAPHLLRVVAVTQSDPFFTGPFFSSFLDEIENKAVRLVEIVVLPNFSESRAALAKRLVGLYGPAGFVRLAWRYGRARLSDRRGMPRTVEAIAANRGIALRHQASVNRPESAARLHQQQIDVLLSVAAPEILDRSALSAAPLALNVHSGRLPDYRGMMPTFWALLNGDREIVVTVHEMAEKVDSGVIVAEFPVAVRPHESAFDLAARTKAVAGREVARLLDRIGKDPRARRSPEQRPGGRYYGFPRRADARALRARGGRLL